MPMYTKILKAILSKEREVDEHEIFALGEEHSVMVLNKLPAKLKDPNSFFIPCLIGSVSVNRALCDLGLSVSLKPYSIFKRLDIGQLRSTHIYVQLANRSIKDPLGILEDVP